MKKTLLETIAPFILALCIASLFYFFGAFVAMDLNPANWEVVGRIFIGIFQLMSIIGAFIYEYLD